MNELARAVKEANKGEFDDVPDEVLEKQLQATKPDLYVRFYGERSMDKSLRGAKIQAAPWQDERVPLKTLAPALAAVGGPAVTVAAAAADALGEAGPRTPWTPAEVKSTIPDIAAQAGELGGRYLGKGSPVAGAVGAGVAGGAGKLVERSIVDPLMFPQAERTPLSDLPMEIAKEVALQAAMSGAGSAGEAAVSKTFAPFAKAVDQDVLAAATRQGVEMPASGLSRSKLVGFAEGWASSGPLGGETLQRIERSSKSLDGIADHIIERQGKLADPKARGEALYKGLNEYNRASQSAEHALYDKVVKTMPSVKMDASRTVATIDGMIRDLESAGRVGGAETSAIEQLAVLRNDLANAPTIEDAWNKTKRMNAKLANTFEQVHAGGDKGSAQKIALSLKADVRAALQQSAPESLGALRVADEFHRARMQKLDSAVAEHIKSLAQAGDYERIGTDLARLTRTGEDVTRIAEMLGPEGRDAARAAVVVDILTSGRKGDVAAQTITPDMIQRNMRKYGEGTLKSLLSPEEFAQLQDVGLLEAAMQRPNKVLNNSPTAPLLRIGMYSGSIGSAATGTAMGNPAALMALGAIIGDSAFNKLVSTKAGQRFLTTGFNLGPGGRAAVQSIPRTGKAGFEALAADDQQARLDRAIAEEQMMEEARQRYGYRLGE